MPDYQKSKIYKIVDANEEMVYVGSTVNTLARRMAHHRATYKYDKYRDENYVSSHDIFDKYGVENCKILLLENYPCNGKEELLKREGEYIRQLNCVNKTIPNRTRDEWRENNKEKIAERHKIYYENNKEKITEQHKIWCDSNKEQIKEYNRIYREKNKEQIKKNKSEYYLKNKS